MIIIIYLFISFGARARGTTHVMDWSTIDIYVEAEWNGCENLIEGKWAPISQFSFFFIFRCAELHSGIIYSGRIQVRAVYRYVCPTLCCLLHMGHSMGIMFLHFFQFGFFDSFRFTRSELIKLCAVSKWINDLYFSFDFRAIESDGSIECVWNLPCP